MYVTEFVVDDPGNGTLRYEPAGVSVAPGDQLSLSETAASGGAVLSLSDLDTGRSASLTGPGFTAALGASVLAGAIASGGHGHPLISGSHSAATPSPVLAGPVPSSPMIFGAVQVDGRPLSALGGVGELTWKSASGATLASASGIFSTDDFAVSFATPKPVLATSANLAPVSGTVLVKGPGAKRFVRVRAIANIPVGSTIDVRDGSVQITAATPDGGTQSAVFYSGEFILRQARGGAVTAVLSGGSFARCPKPPHPVKKGVRIAAATFSPGGTIASGAKHKPKKVRQLWANAHGSFTTQGQYGSAAVSGTQWLTQDECDGTYFLVTRHQILVTSFTLHRKILLRQGHHYLAPAPGL